MRIVRSRHSVYLHCGSGWYISIFYEISWFLDSIIPSEISPPRRRIIRSSVSGWFSPRTCYVLQLPIFVVEDSPLSARSMTCNLSWIRHQICENRLQMSNPLQERSEMFLILTRSRYGKKTFWFNSLLYYFQLLNLFSSWISIPSNFFLLNSFLSSYLSLLSSSLCLFNSFCILLCFSSTNFINCNCLSSFSFCLSIFCLCNSNVWVCCRRIISTSCLESSSILKSK